jgi:UDP-N-acetylmuramate--alanine ligase
MFDPKTIKTAHCIGIGGIHVSAVARLLQSRGVTVTGSDGVQSDETDRLNAEGIKVTIGHDAANVPADVDVIIYSDAVPETNPERAEAAKRQTPSFDTHSFLGLMFSDARQVVITGSHGKSTTTAMVGKILEAAGVNPTVVVGTRVPGFEKGNLRIGREDLLVVEGDEFRSHVLAYKPTVLAITNKEWDHPDVFPTEHSYFELFEKAKSLVSSGGKVIEGPIDIAPDLHLAVPGEMNVKNASLALATALAFDPSLDRNVLVDELNKFPGVWRRFERVGEFNGALVISDYAHHPTEVRETLKAARQAYPDRRLVLCYQPHQHARTKGLFPDFVKVLAEPDVLVLAEIYDVPGRKEEKDASVSSKAIIEQLTAPSLRSYAPDIADAERQLRDLTQPNDLILVMGAGPIDKVARNLVKS